MKKLTNSLHDKNFKLSLNNKEVAKDFLCTCLSKSILKTIKLSTLKICPDPYVSAKHNIVSLLEFTQKHIRDQKFLTNSIKDLVAITMLEERVDLNFICKVTKLTIKEVNQIKEESAKLK